MKKTLKLEAARKLEAYLKTGIAGLYQQAWDRLRELNWDVELRREATEANARALLWMATNR